MSRRLAISALTVLVAVGAVAPAMAAPKPVKGSYTVTLLPDPTLQVAEACYGLNPAARDEHPFTVPSAGTFDVKLVSEDVGGLGRADWDLYLVAGDEVLAASEGPTAQEQIVKKFKAKTPLSIHVCNLDGDLEGTVSFVFTPKK